jgi:serine/threonine-protein kinase
MTKNPPPLPPSPPALPTQKGGSGAESHGDALSDSKPTVVQIGQPTEGAQESTLPPDDSGDEDAYRKVKKNKKFGRYELLMEMSQGGMATLYLARISGPEGFEKLLAVKKIHDHLSRKKEFVKMFLDEARIAARIQHPNVAAIYDMGSIDDTYFIAMEYVHGQNLTELLRALIRQKSRLEWPYVVRIMIDAAAGLHAAHELKSATGKPLNVVHRDVSPQNLLVSYEGHVKVVDFGIAYAAERLGETKTGTLKGKAAYMSPEQAEASPLDRRSDIFSLGVVLHEAVCLRRLFREESEAATLLKVREADAPSPRSIQPDIPADLDRIIMKCLAKEPADRFDTAGELAEALEELLVSQGKTVNAARLSKLLKRVFYDKKKIKDEQIERCLEGEPSEPMKGAGMGSTTETSINMMGESSIGQAPKSPKLLVGTIAGAAAAVVAAIAILIYFLAARPEPAQQTKRPAGKTGPIGAEAQRDEESDAKDRNEPEPGQAAKKQKVKLAVEIEPAGASAKIVFRGKTYTGPRFQALVPRSEKLENLKVTAPGFQTETVAVTLDESQTLPVELKPIKRPARTSEQGRIGKKAHRRTHRRRTGRRRTRRRRTPRRRTSRGRLLFRDLE